MRFAGRAVGGILLVTGLVTCSIHATDPRTEVQSAVRDYFEAVNRADPTAIMEMFSRNAEATSVMEGDLVRGWQAIRIETDKIAGTRGEYKWAPGTMEVIPLGKDHALVVVPVNVTHTLGTGKEEMVGASTLVLEKKDGKWKILHEHHSVEEPSDFEDDSDTTRG